MLTLCVCPSIRFELRQTIEKKCKHCRAITDLGAMTNSPFWHISVPVCWKCRAPLFRSKQYWRRIGNQFIAAKQEDAQ